MYAVDFPSVQQFVIALVGNLFSKLQLHHKHLFLTTKLHLFNRKQLRVFKRLTSGALGSVQPRRARRARWHGRGGGGSECRAGGRDEWAAERAPSTCARLAPGFHRSRA